MNDMYPAEIDHAGQRPSVWLMTFADITALLLAFFVMLFAMSSLEPEKWQSVISRVVTVDQREETKAPPPDSPDTVSTEDIAPALPTDYLSQVLAEKFKRHAILSRVMVHRLDRQVILSLPSDALFKSGEIVLTPAAREALFGLASAVATLGNQIDVYGHADKPPESQRAFTSKWTLSLARAVAVASELKRTGLARNVTMLGLGDSRFSHLHPNLSVERRHALARRVDIVIHSTEGET